MFTRPQKYFATARSFLSSAMHTGRGFLAHVDGAVQRGWNIYTKVKPIAAAAADMCGTPQQKAFMGQAARGLETAAGEYDWGRKLLLQFHGAMG